MRQDMSKSVFNRISKPKMTGVILVTTCSLQFEPCRSPSFFLFTFKVFSYMSSSLDEGVLTMPAAIINNRANDVSTAMAAEYLTSF